MSITPSRFTFLPLLFATSAAALLACGDEPAKQFADAPRTDAATDAALPDAATSGIVEVTVANSAGPVASATVLFQNADDSVVATKTTDAAGIASQAMNVGGSITVIVVGPNETQTFTVLAVKPGDKLKIRANGIGSEQILTQVSLTMPPNSFGSYEVLSSCGTQNRNVTANNAGALDMLVPPSCTQASWLVKRQATSGSGGTAAAAIYKTNVALANGAFDLSDQTFTGLMVQNIAGTNMPEVFNLQTSVAPLLSGFLGNIDESQASITAPVFPTFAGTFERANAAATKQLVKLDVRGAAGFQLFAAITNVGDVTIDGATALAPWVSDVQFSQADSSFIISTNPGGNAPINGAFVRLDVNRKSGSLRRQVIGPAATALRLPILPTAQVDLNVLPNDFTNVREAGIISSPGGYDALRPVFYIINGPDEFFGTTPTVNAQVCASMYSRLD